MTPDEVEALRRLARADQELAALRDSLNSREGLLISLVLFRGFRSRWLDDQDYLIRLRRKRMVLATRKPACASP